jgi:stage V sporulation protein B
MFPAAILFGLAELLIPELARCAAAGSQKRIQYLVGRSLRVAMLYGCLCCGIMCLLSQDLCVALYGSPEAGEYLQRFAFLIPMLYCDAITDAMTKGLGQQKACVRYNILTSGLDVLFLYLLLPHYGMGGYFFSFLITHLLNFILSLRRLLKIAGNVISLKTAAITLGCTLAAILAGSYVTAVLGRIVAYLLVLGSLLTLFRIVSQEDIRWLKGLLTG